MLEQHSSLLPVMNALSFSLSLSVWPRHGQRLSHHGMTDVKWCHPKLVVEVKHLAGSKTAPPCHGERLRSIAEQGRRLSNAASPSALGRCSHSPKLYPCLSSALTTAVMVPLCPSTSERAAGLGVIPWKIGEIYAR